MSSPVGHSLAGYVIAAWRDKSLKPRSLLLLGLYVFLANAPDLDFIPGILRGTPNMYHHGISHSIGFGLMFALVAGALISLRGGKRFGREFLFMFALYGSHLVLDLLSMDGRPPFGIPILWPFSDHYFMIPLLPPVMHSVLDDATIGQFLADVFSKHNLYVIGLEMMLTVPFLVVLSFFSRRKVRHA